MKILFLLLISLFELSPCFAQCDSLPISVFIKVDSAYVRTYSKKGKFIKDLIRANNSFVKGDSINEKFFNISVTLKNTSDTIISITLMSCSWQDNFVVNNNYIYIEGENCDNNFAIDVDFKPGESKTYTTRLIQSIKLDYPCKGCAPFAPVETTKLGLIVLNDPFGGRTERINYYLGMEDKSTWTMVWSNPLYLLTESEAHPKPLEFGIYQKGQN
ncbi:MAG: hypothetical protein U0U70_16620 [Chitinophagaceae bacterium]